VAEIILYLSLSCCQNCHWVIVKVFIYHWVVVKIVIELLSKSLFITELLSKLSCCQKSLSCCQNYQKIWIWADLHQP